MNRIQRFQRVLKQFNSIYVLRSISVENSMFERKFCTKNNSNDESKDSEQLNKDTVDKNTTSVESADTNVSNLTDISTQRFKGNDNNMDQADADIANLKFETLELKTNKRNIKKNNAWESSDIEDFNEQNNSNSMGNQNALEHNALENIPEYVAPHLLNSLPEDVWNVKQPTFATLFRNSKFVYLGDPKGKMVIGQVFNVVGNDMYIDFGWKFHCVCPIPKKNSRFYVKGSIVYITINDLELSSRFLGAATDITLLEADCTLIGLKWSPLKPNESWKPNESKLDHDTV